MKFQRKIALFLVFVFVLTAAILPATASATYQTAGSRADRAAYATVVRMVDRANSLVDSYVRIAQLTPYDDVNWMLFMVSLTVNPVLAYADRVGVEVVCEYDTYRIDGKTVAVDPLHVININVDD